MVKHTHSVTFWYEHQSYQDSFMFTPSDPERAKEEALERIERERARPADRIEVKELPNAAGDARHLRVSDFCDALIKQADKSGGGLPWRRFIGRRSVEHELQRRGYALCEEGADHDPRLKRFFAMPPAVSTASRATPIKPEYP